MADETRRIKVRWSNLGDLEKAADQAMANLNMGAIKTASDFKSALEKELNRMAFQKMLKSQWDGFNSHAARAWDKTAKGMGQSFEKAMNIGVSALSSPMEALQGSIKGLFAAAKGAGDQVNKRMRNSGKSMQDSNSRVVKGFGKMLQRLGPVIGMMGTMVGALTSVVSLLFSAEAQAKEMNNQIVQSGIAGGELASGMGSVKDALTAMRTAATDFRNNMAMGTLAQEQIEVIGAFHEAGFTIQEMTSDITNAQQAMKDYHAATEIAVTYSKLLGQSSSEIAQMQARYMEEMGGGLNYIAGQFSSVFTMAMNSGFGVKRFTSMVQQATTGMTFYNTRIDEAAGLLLRLGGILGSEISGDFLQQINKGFMDEGMTDRYRRIMTTGSANMEEIFDRSAENVARAFGQKLGSMSEDAQGEIAAIMQNANLSVDFATEEGRTAIIDQLGQLDPQAQAKLLAEIRAVDEDMARQLGNLASISEGSAGGLQNMAENLGSLDMGGTLAAQLMQANAVLGKPLHELNGIQIAAFENITGISGEQREILKKVSEGLFGNFAVLEERAARNEELSEEQKQEMVRAYGAYTENGRIITAALDRNGEIIEGSQADVDSVGDYIQSQGNTIAEAMQEPVAEDIALARELADNTTSLQQILEMGVQYYLEQIYQVMQVVSGTIADLLKATVAATPDWALDLVGLSRDELMWRSDQSHMLAEQGSLMAQEQEAAANLQKQMDQLNSEIRNASSDEEKARLEEEKAALESQMAEQRIQMAGSEAFVTEVRGAASNQEFRDTAAQRGEIRARGRLGARLDQEGYTGGVDSYVSELQSRALDVTADYFPGGGYTRDSTVGQNFLQSVTPDMVSLDRVVSGVGADTAMENLTSVDVLARSSAHGGDNSLQRINQAFGEMTAERSAMGFTTSYATPEDMQFSVRNPVSTTVEAGPSPADLEIRQRANQAAQTVNRSGFLENTGDDLTPAERAQNQIRSEIASLNSDIAAATPQEGYYDPLLQQEFPGNEGDSEVLAALEEQKEKLLSNDYFEQVLADQISQDEDFQKRLQDQALAAEEGQRTDQAALMAKLVAEEQEKAEAIQMIRALTSGSETDRLVEQARGGDISGALASLNDELGALSPEERSSTLDRYGGVSGYFNDFMRLPDGKLIGINQNDTILGMRPGGPVDQALNGGGGGRGPVTINISGDTGNIYRVVKQVLTDTGHM